MENFNRKIKMENFDLKFKMENLNNEHEMVQLLLLLVLDLVVTPVL